MRKKTRQISLGGVKIGGAAPVSIQSMTKVASADVKASIRQIRRLEAAGCQIVRLAVRNREDALAIRAIKRKINIPVVADIHFNYRLAIESINSGADKIRLNPGNITKPGEISAVITAAKKARIPIRIGVNSGSALSRDLAGSAKLYIKLFERLNFHDIIISLKASDVKSTVEAYREMSKACGYPLHLGVTAAGPYDSGIVKSAVGIGALLLDGIGDTIRVSLTEDPVEEVKAAKRILSAAGVRNFGPDIISCPACGRCQVNLSGIVRDLERKLYDKRPLSIAVMGCEVNGPGEAKEADIGIAFGKGSGLIFRKGKILKKVSEKSAVRELLHAIRHMLSKGTR